MADRRHDDGGDPAPFDPWTATLEQAAAAQDQHPDLIDPAGPLYQWNAAANVRVSRRQSRTDGVAASMCSKPSRTVRGTDSSCLSGLPAPS